jgi:hypothetical protein
VKKLNLGLMVLNTDLKVGEGLSCERFSWREEAKETRGSLRLLRRRPVTPMSRVDYNEGFVLSELIVLIIEDYSDCNNISNDKKIL